MEVFRLGDVLEGLEEDVHAELVEVIKEFLNPRIVLRALQHLQADVLILSSIQTNPAANIATHLSFHPVTRQ